MPAPWLWPMCDRSAFYRTVEFLRLNLSCTFFCGLHSQVLSYSWRFHPLYKVFMQLYGKSTLLWKYRHFFPSRISSRLVVAEYTCIQSPLHCFGTEVYLFWVARCTPVWGLYRHYMPIRGDNWPSFNGAHAWLVPDSTRNIPEFFFITCWILQWIGQALDIFTCTAVPIVPTHTWIYLTVSGSPPMWYVHKIRTSLFINRYTFEKTCIHMLYVFINLTWYMF